MNDKVIKQLENQLVPRPNLKASTTPKKSHKKPSLTTKTITVLQTEFQNHLLNFRTISLCFTQQWVK